jgi:Concanavalin A-like lectin/glucanases superfamily
MRLNNIIFKSAIFAMGLGMAVSGCEKVEQPALGTYPTDSNPPGGPLKFYTAYDGINADSIRANFANTDSSISYTDGVSGQAVQFNPMLAASGADSVYSFLVYPNANDFASVATSFTVSFWMKIPLTKKDPVNADGILALSSTSNFWGNITIFADHFTGVTDSMQLKFHFANGSGDNWDFAGYTGVNMWPSMYDDMWHQVVFSYDATTLTATLYRDGVQFDQKANETIIFDGNASSFVVGGFQQAGGINGDYAGNGWMSGFPGEMDQVKLYAEALTSDQVATSFANKQ